MGLPVQDDSGAGDELTKLRRGRAFHGSGPQAAWCRTAAWLASAPGTVDVDYILGDDWLLATGH